MERYKAQYEARLVLIHSFLSPFSRNESSLVLLSIHPVLKKVIDLCTALSIDISRSSLLYTFCNDNLYEGYWCFSVFWGRTSLAFYFLWWYQVLLCLRKWTLRIPIFVLLTSYVSPCCELFRNENRVYWYCSLISPKLVRVCITYLKSVSYGAGLEGMTEAVRWELFASYVASAFIGFS